MISFKLNFTLNQLARKMQNNIPTVYISEIYCCIMKSTNLSTILQFNLYKKYEKI